MNYKVILDQAHPNDNDEYLLRHEHTYIQIHQAKFQLNPFMPTGAFNIYCPRDCVSRHNGDTAGAPLKPLRVGLINA